MRKLFLLIPILFLFNAKKKVNTENYTAELNKIAAKYVTLGLTIGEYDADFVGVYYGPDSLKPTQPKSKNFPKDSLLKEVFTLQVGLKQ